MFHDSGYLDNVKLVLHVLVKKSTHFLNEYFLSCMKISKVLKESFTKVSGS
jgi:hypothetical protein